MAEEFINIWHAPQNKLKGHLHLLKNDSLGVGSTSEGVGLPSGSEMGLLVVLVVPPLITAVVAQLARRTDSHRLSHVCGRLQRYA